MLLPEKVESNVTSETKFCGAIYIADLMKFLTLDFGNRISSCIYLIVDQWDMACDGIVVRHENIEISKNP